MEGFRNKLKIEDIKEEMTNSMDLESERKMTPLKIKEELDKYIIGQDHVKRSIAIALSKFYSNFQDQDSERGCYLSPILKI
jgi:ATP-dependent protease Clp ATPase subunit